MELEEGGMERGDFGGFLGVGKKGIVGNQGFLGLRKADNIYRYLAYSDATGDIGRVMLCRYRFQNI